MVALRTNPLYLLTVLSLLIVVSEWLVRRTAFRHMGSALLVILLGAIVSNLGVIPASSSEALPVPVYDAIFAYVAPISIFWLVLPVNLRAVLQAGRPMLLLFLIGAVGTALGAIIGMWVVDGASTIGPLYRAIGGMFTGTYTGGSINFNAVALQYDVQRQGLLYGGTIVVDNIITAVWMAVTLIVPRALVRWRGTARTEGAPAAGGAPIVELAAERETLTPMSFAVVLALGTGALLLANSLADVSSARGLAIPSILILTTIALGLAQVPAVGALPGVRVVGMYAVYLFLAVIGAFCDLQALSGLGELGVVLLTLATIIVLVHGTLTFGAALIFRLDLHGAAVASQANVGGGTSALALAKSLGREDLILPGILLGALGNGLGTFLGFAVVSWL